MTNKERVAEAIKEYSGINIDYLEHLGFQFEDDAECFVLFGKQDTGIIGEPESEIEIDLFEGSDDNMIWINDQFVSININNANDIIALKSIFNI